MAWVEVFVEQATPATIKGLEREGVDTSRAKREWAGYRADRVLRIVDNVVIEVIEPSQELLVNVYNELLNSLPHTSNILANILDTQQRLLHHLKPFITLYFTIEGYIETGYSSSLEWFHGEELVNNVISEYGMYFIRDYDGITRARVYTGRPYTTENLVKGLQLLCKLLKLYIIIKSIQEAKAVEVAISFLK